MALTDPISASFVNATTLTATVDAAGNTDLREQCAIGVRIRANCGADGYKYGVVSAVSYSAPTTTIQIVGDDLTANLVSFWHSNDTPESMVHHAGQHMAGADDAIAPSDIGAMPADRRIDTTGPLYGGGDLWSNLELGIDDASESGPGAVELATAAETQAGTDTSRAVTPAGVSAAIAALSPVVGQCRLTLSGSTLLLSPQDGNMLTIDAVMRALPSSGPTLAATGVANTTYYIYGYWSGSAVALEASTTAPAWDARNNCRVKTGDVTRSLVGMARTNSSGQWVSSASERFVLSYYNRQKLGLVSTVLSTDTTTASGTPVALTSIRCDFLTFAANMLVAMHTRVKNTNVSTSSTGIYMDGVPLSPNMILTDTPIINAGFPDSGYHALFASEGRHYIDACIYVFSGTGTWPAWSTVMVSEVMG